MKKQLLFIFFLFPVLVFSQNKWVRDFYDYDHFTARKVIESYDGGYYILGNYKDKDWYTWLKKLDVNGNELWTREFTGEGKYLNLADLVEDKEGNLYLGGECEFLEYNSENPLITAKDPVLVKINACGELVFGKIYHTPDNHFDYIKRLFLQENGNILVELYHKSWSNVGKSSSANRIGLFSMSSSGEILWSQYINIANGCFSDISYGYRFCSNGDILISGCSYVEKPGTKEGWSRGWLLRADSEANIKWISIPTKDIWDSRYTHDNNWCAVESPDKKSIYAAFRRMVGKAILHTGIMKFDATNGKYLGVNNFFDQNGTSLLTEMQFINENLLVGCYGYTLKSEENIIEEEVPGCIILFDTMANIRNKVDLKAENFPKMLLTRDQKILMCHNSDSSKEKIILQKYNLKLEHDTIYTKPGTFDYKCNHSVEKKKEINVKDFQALEGAVGINESQNPLRLKELKAFPNPFKDKFKVVLPEYIQDKQSCEGIKIVTNRYSYHEDVKLEILDINGRVIQVQKVDQAFKELWVYADDWIDGIYLVRLIVKGKIAARVKVIKGN
ncbi:MAG: T9SS type A sorting domain-containing protein [Bacteroidales bacterium]